MKILIIHHILGVLLFLGIGFSGANNVFSAENSEFIKDSFSNVMVKNLLRLSDAKAAQGQIEDYREWIEQIQPILNKKNLNIHEMKAYFLILFVAEARFYVHTLEFISETIVKKFEDNIDVFLKTMHELPYLMPVIGTKINTHFNTFSYTTEKNKFINKYYDTFVDYLGNRQGRDFVQYIKEGNYSLYH